MPTQPCISVNSSRRIVALHSCVALALFLFPFVGNAQWKEVTPALPSYPRDESLLLVKLPPRDTIKLYVDTDSIAIGEDGVARLNLVIVGTKGARNVFFEGLRCATLEHKTYAYGTADHRMVAISRARWQELPRYDVNNYLRLLHKTYVCDHTDAPRAKSEIVRRIKYDIDGSVFDNKY